MRCARCSRPKPNAARISFASPTRSPPFTPATSRKNGWLTRCFWPCRRIKDRKEQGGKALMAEDTYWRIRMREGEFSTDHSQEAWDRNEVGIWYGAWSAEDFAKAESSKDVAAYLSKLPEQRALGWPVNSHYVE